MLLDFPVIGDIVISPNSKVKDEKGNDKYDLLECDGSVLDTESYPTLNEILPTEGFGNFENIGTLTSSDAQNQDTYGASVSLYEGRLVVSSNLEDTAATDAGKVYIYDWNENSQTYEEVTTLVASDAEANDYFGTSVALEGDRLVVGAYAEDTWDLNAGKVYVYDWNENSQTYDEISSLISSDVQFDDRFGTSVALEGDRLIVGAQREDTGGSNAGKVYVYDWNGSSYDEVTTLIASDAEANDYFGTSVALEGDRLVVGAYRESTAATDAGKVYVYDWNGSSYDEVTTLVASDAEANDRFGSSVSIFNNRLVVGSFFEDTSASDGGKVYVYDWNGSSYDEVTTLVASDAENEDLFGYAVSLYNGTLIISAKNEDTAAPDGGKVYIYASTPETSLPNITSPSGLVPYKIVADLS